MKKVFNFKDAREALSFYRKQGLVVIPLLPKSKKPAVSGWNQLDGDKLVRNFKAGFNIGVRLDGLVVVNIEKAELWNVLFDKPVEEVASTTWLQRTGKGGYHVYFRGEAEPLEVEGFAELRSSSNQYVVVPPSTHPETGRWITNIRSVSIAEASEKDLDKIKRELEILRRFKPFIEAITQLWRKGHRHFLSLWLPVFLYKSGIPLEGAETILKTVLYLAHDGEVGDKIRALMDTFKKPPEEVRGYSSLRDELASMLGVKEASRILSLLPAEIREGIKKCENIALWKKPELLKAASTYIDEKIKFFMSLPYPENVYKYHEWIKREVLRDIAAGEEENKLIVYTMITLGKDYILILTGPSTLGKTFLLDSFVDLVDDVIVVNRVTEHGIDYLDPEEVKGKILYIKEVEVAGGHAAFVLKGLEDHGGEGLTYVVAYPVKDPNGRISTIMQKLKLKGFITTSNREDVNVAGLQERMYTLSLDPSPEQNRRVLEFLDRMRIQQYEVEFGMREWTDNDWSKASAYCLARKLRESKDRIMIPYTDLCQKILSPLVNELEVKRYAKKLLALLEWFGKLFKFFLPEVEAGNNKMKILTIEVLELGLRYFYRILGAKEELKKPAEVRFGERLLEYLQKNRAEEKIVRIDRLGRKMLAKHLGLSDVRIRALLNGLAEAHPSAILKTVSGRETSFTVNIEELSNYLLEWAETPCYAEIWDRGRLREDLKKELEKDLNRWLHIGNPSSYTTVISMSEKFHPSFSERYVRSNPIIQEIIEFKQISSRKNHEKRRKNILITALPKNHLEYVSKPGLGLSINKKVSRTCYMCGRGDTKLYPIKLYALGYRLLCRSCANEAIA